MNKSNVMNIEDMETYFNKCRKIKFEDTVEINSLDDVFTNFFGWMGTNNKDDKSKDTFYNTNRIHCKTQNNWGGSKYRSINDFIVICKKYYPDMSVKNILKYLRSREDIHHKNGYNFSIAYCGNIRKHNIRGVTKGTYYIKLKEYNLKDLFPKMNNTVEEITSL